MRLGRCPHSVRDSSISDSPRAWASINSGGLISSPGLPLLLRCAVSLLDPSAFFVESDLSLLPAFASSFVSSPPGFFEDPDSDVSFLDLLGLDLPAGDFSNFTAASINASRRERAWA